MCGRFVRIHPVSSYADLLDSEGAFDLKPSYNVAPGQAVLVSRLVQGRRVLDMLHWGLIPYWAKDKKTGYSLINARAETVAGKPSFRAAFRQRRCLIATDGFYEWKRQGSPKQPYFIGLRTGEPFAFAGLWEHWEGKGETVDSCTIIVTEANELVSAIHDRMPVILPRQSFDAWMDPELKDPGRLQELLKPYPAGLMQARPVSTRVNNARNDDPELLAGF